MIWWGPWRPKSDRTPRRLFRTRKKTRDEHYDSEFFLNMLNAILIVYPSVVTNKQFSLPTNTVAEPWQVIIDYLPVGRTQRSHDCLNMLNLSWEYSGLPNTKHMREIHLYLRVTCIFVRPCTKLASYLFYKIYRWPNSLWIGSFVNIFTFNKGEYSLEVHLFSKFIKHLETAFHAL